MIFGFIIDVAVGALLMTLGLLIWKKQKIDLLHSYHYRNVKERDMADYCRLMGIGLILTAVGICFSGLLSLLLSSFWWIPLCAGFIIGIAVINRAQKRYNGSWFS